MVTPPQGLPDSDTALRAWLEAMRSRGYPMPLDHAMALDAAVRAGATFTWSLDAEGHVTIEMTQIPGELLGALDVIETGQVIAGDRAGRAIVIESVETERTDISPIPTGARERGRDCDG